MIHFHNQATLQVLRSLVIVTHSWSQEFFFFTSIAGTWLCSNQNLSVNTDSTVVYLVFLPISLQAEYCLVF